MLKDDKDGDGVGVGVEDEEEVNIDLMGQMKMYFIRVKKKGL